jgi:hypothetical protein
VGTDANSFSPDSRSALVPLISIRTLRRHRRPRRRQRGLEQPAAIALIGIEQRA